LDTKKYPLFSIAWTMAMNPETKENLSNWLQRLSHEDRKKFFDETLAATKEMLEEREDIDSQNRSQGKLSYKEAILVSAIMEALKSAENKSEQDPK
jgi:hypothetical protein